MSGHTFKVGDRVRRDDGAATWKVVALEGLWAWVTRDDGHMPLTCRIETLHRLPPFEPVERWVILHSNGEVAGHTYQKKPQPSLVNGAGWVKVVVVPAETWEQMTGGTPSNGGEEA